MGLRPAAPGNSQASTIGRLVSPTLYLTFCLIVLGGAVRATQSGLACPDWPFCFGKVIPHFNFQIFMEWIHRAVAGVVSLLFFTTAYQILKSPENRRYYGTQIVLGCILLSTQIVLGGLTVLHLLDPKIVALHLTNALVFFAVLMTVGKKAKLAKSGAISRVKLPIFHKIAIACVPVFVLGQICLGGFVSSSHAGLACPDFPTCNGSWSVTAGGYQALLQMSHRYLAFFVLIYATLVRQLCRPFVMPLKLTLLLRAVPSLVLMQITLGLLNVMLKMPLWASVAHLALATALFATSMVCTLEVFLGSKDLNQPSPANDDQLHNAAEGHVNLMATRAEAPQT